MTSIECIYMCVIVKNKTSKYVNLLIYYNI